jgi:lipid-A-disaccharide synthase-like uncharacterized protein
LVYDPYNPITDYRKMHNFLVLLMAITHGLDLFVVNNANPSLQNSQINGIPCQGVIDCANLMCSTNNIYTVQITSDGIHSCPKTLIQMFDIHNKLNFNLIILGISMVLTFVYYFIIQFHRSRRNNLSIIMLFITKIAVYCTVVLFVWVPEIIGIGYGNGGHTVVYTLFTLAFIIEMSWIYSENKRHSYEII